MKSKLLLPHKARWIGVILFIPAFILGFAFLIYNYELSFLNVELKNWMFIIKEDGLFQSTNNNLTDEVALSFTVIGLLLITFSREKTEDEFIQKLRLESLQWAVLVSYFILIICTWLIFGSSFFVAMVANLLTVLVIFNLRFHWILYISNTKKDRV
jgi:hypothetical protein